MDDTLKLKSRCGDPLSFYLFIFFSLRRKLATGWVMFRKNYAFIRKKQAYGTCATSLFLPLFIVLIKVFTMYRILIIFVM